MALIPRSQVWDLAEGLVLLLHNGGVLECIDGTPVSIEQLIKDRQVQDVMLAGRSDVVCQYREWLTPIS
ncbi:MAG: hypothetical protein CSA21_01355 [Deltaproteobacteria bacterium]|nr:MAG: hypothetical protein CSA21_01355 [Deltaproteobacteria bacterium]